MANPELSTKSILLSNGRSLFESSMDQKVLLVFLRHFGCTFCREALDTLSKKRGEIEAAGGKIVLVHLSDQEQAKEFFSRYQLADLEAISDPDAKLYDQYGLIKGNFNQLFGLKVLLRTVDSAFIKGHGGWRTIGDGFQMPGVFVIYRGEIRSRFVHEFISDKPDYLGMLSEA